ncbi:MAG: hypothetical protein CVU39_02140 [Chloroflexi bacterium HGW-Chloroflexi-10]|nr:MAG: hypothetical protein CVU39_02140 [Chloroflexi bacterium HGW-Chloroflexi-10]
MKRNKFIMLAVIIMSALVLSACGGGGGDTSEEVTVPAPYSGMTNPFDGDSTAAAAGEEIYVTKCVSCHGETGKGDGPAGQALTPPAGDLTKIVSTIGDDYLFYRISEGGAMDPFNSSMPAQKSVLSEDEIWQVVTHIKSFK